MAQDTSGGMTSVGGSHGAGRAEPSDAGPVGGRWLEPGPDGRAPAPGPETTGRELLAAVATSCPPLGPPSEPLPPPPPPGEPSVGGPPRTPTSGATPGLAPAVAAPTLLAALTAAATTCWVVPTATSPQ